MGGTTEAIFGENFGHGFAIGAMTSVIGYLANHEAHKVIITVQGEVSVYDTALFEGKEVAIGKEEYDPKLMTGAARREYVTKPEMRKGVYATFSAADIKSQTVRVNDYLSADARFKNRVLDVSAEAMSRAKGVKYTTDGNALGVVKNATVIYFRRW